MVIIQSKFGGSTYKKWIFYMYDYDDSYDVAELQQHNQNYFIPARI